MAATATKETTVMGSVPDYTEDPGAFLLFHNWKPLGPVKSPRTEWVDPSKPWPDGVYSKIDVYSKDQDGNVGRQTHKNEKGQMVNTQQVLWSPPAVPMIQEMAIRTQVERDMRAAHAAAREEAKLLEAKKKAG